MPVAVDLLGSMCFTCSFQQCSSQNQQLLEPWPSFGSQPASKLYTLITISLLIILTDQLN